jgi:magnesium-transporting ATPase (P-type)
MTETSKTTRAATLGIDDLIRELGTDPDKDLTSPEAKHRLEKYGKNALGEEEKEPLLKHGIFSNGVMVLWALSAIGLLLVVIYVPFLQGLVRVSALNLIDWATVVAASVIATIWIEA